MVPPKFVPFNPTAKRTMAFVERITNTARGADDDSESKGDADNANDAGDEDRVKRWTVSKGSPQVILGLCYSSLTADERHAIDVQINLYAGRGYRTLGVARCREFASQHSVEGHDFEEKWEFLGLIPMFDPPRHDTKMTIERAIELGIEVKMVTGDHGAIGVDTARRLGMGSNILGTQIFQEVDTFGSDKPMQFNYTDMVEHGALILSFFPLSLTIPLPCCS